MEKISLNNSIVLAPRSLQGEFLKKKEDNPELDFYLFTLEEIEECFDYIADDRLLLFLLRKGYSLDYSYELLPILKSVGLYKVDSKFNEFKLLQKEAIGLGLLKENEYANFEFVNKSIYVKGYFNRQYIEKVLNRLGVKEIIFDSVQTSNKPLIHQFDDVYEELHYIFNNICSEIDKGKDINDIYLVGARSEILPLIKEFGKQYNIGIPDLSSNSLIDLSFVKNALYIYEKEGLDTVNEYLNSIDDINLILVKKAFNQLSIFEEKNKNINLLKDYFALTSSHKKVFKNVINISSSYVFPENASVYVMGFALGSFPRGKEKENVLIPDSLLLELGKCSSFDKYIEDQKACVNLITSDNVKLISFSSNILGTSCTISSLKDMLELKVTSDNNLDFEYSNSKGLMLAASLLDLKREYLFIDDRLNYLEDCLNASSVCASYKNNLNHVVAVESDKSLYFSPSSLKSYYYCNFKYFIERVLKIGEGKETFFLEIGNLFHAILEDHYKNGLGFDESWDKNFDEINKRYPFTETEKILLIKLKEEMKSERDYILEMDNNLPSLRVEAEKEIKGNVKNCKNVSICGRIDKTLYYNINGINYYFVIDYKTGSERFDESLVDYGLSLQLPIYVYWLKENQGEDYNLAGLFISPLLSITPLLDDKTIEENRRTALKLKGLFINKPSATLPFKDYIVSYNLNKDGEHYAGKSKYTSFKSEKELDELAKKAEKKIIEAAEGLRKNDFSINPKFISAKLNSCSNCPYMNLCYREESQYVYLDNSGKEENN